MPSSRHTELSLACLAMKLDADLHCQLNLNCFANMFWAALLQPPKYSYHCEDRIGVDYRMCTFSRSYGTLQHMTLLLCFVFSTSVLA